MKLSGFRAYWTGGRHGGSDKELRNSQFELPCIFNIHPIQRIEHVIVAD